MLFSFLLSSLFLLFCSKSSPLYPMNDWVDVNCYMTIGKGMLHGKVPYVDLYEQKGPVLYFIYAIVALFSNRSFFGQYLLEVITFGLFLYYSGKLAGLYLGKGSLYVYPVLAGLACIVCTTAAFTHGGSVEQLSLFMFLYALYSILNACHENRGLTDKEALVNGIFIGAVFWIKYTMVGFYVGVMLFVLIWYAGWIRNARALLRTLCKILLGFGIVTAVVFAYFLVNRALDDLYTCYFYNNIFLYPTESELTLMENVKQMFNAAMDRNEVFPLFLFFGLSYLLINAKERPRDLLLVAMSFYILMITTYMGKGYVYYALVFAGFTIFGLVAVAAALRAMLASKLFRGIQIHPGLHRNLVTGLLCVYFLLLANMTSTNTYLMDYDKQDLPQYKFADTMHLTHVNPTILNFGFLDGGFYFAADSMPVCPFFCTFNVAAPDMWQTQYNYISSGKVDFVITRRKRLEEYNCNSSKYELVQTADMMFENYNYTYYLYRLKDAA
ncbi:MAG: hypothetical protein IJV82_00745 [Oscillospiraceae bacterium]|nr:hypothetical protein [Oscillospiraceae bacterium]